MATANFMFAEVDPNGAHGGVMPALKVPPILAESIGNPTSSTQSSASPMNGYVQITCDAPVWVIFGPNPTATAGAGKEILVTNYACYSIAKGVKAAVINAS